LKYYNSYVYCLKKLYNKIIGLRMKRLLLVLLLIIVFAKHSIAFAPIQNNNKGGLLYFGSLNMTIEEAMMGMSSSTMVDGKIVVVSLKIYEDRTIVDRLYISIFDKNGINVGSQKIDLPTGHIGKPYSLTIRKISNDTITILIMSVIDNKPNLFMIKYNVSQQKVDKVVSTSLITHSIMGFSKGNILTLPYGIMVSLDDVNITKLRDYGNFFVVPMKNNNDYILFNNISNVNFNGDFTVKYILQVVRNNVIVNGSILSFGFNANFETFNYYNYDPLTELHEYPYRSANANYLYPRIPIKTTYIQDDSAIYILLQPIYNNIVNQPIHFIMLKISRETGGLEWAREYLFTNKIMNSNEFYSIQKIENRDSTRDSTIDIYIKVYNIDYLDNKWRYINYGHYRFVLFDSIRDGMLIIRIRKDNGYINYGGNIYNSGLVYLYSTSNTYSLISDVNIDEDNIIVTLYDKRYNYASHVIFDYETPNRGYTIYTPDGYAVIDIIRPMYIYIKTGSEITYKTVSYSVPAVKTKYVRAYLYYGTYYTFKSFKELGYQKCSYYYCYYVPIKPKSNLVSANAYKGYPPEHELDYYDVRVVYGDETEITKYGVGFKILNNDPRFRVIVIPYKFKYD